MAEQFVRLTNDIWVNPRYVTALCPVNVREGDPPQVEVYMIQDDPEATERDSYVVYGETVKQVAARLSGEVRP